MSRVMLRLNALGFGNQWNIDGCGLNPMTFPVSRFAIGVIIGSAELDWNIVADIPCLARINETFAKVATIVFALEQIEATLGCQAPALRFRARKIGGTTNELSPIDTITDVAPRLSFANPIDQARVYVEFRAQSLARRGCAKNFADLFFA